MEKYIEQFEDCREKERPACAAVCPFSFDRFSFLDKVGKGSWDRAYKIYREGVVFPEIVSRLCEEFCADVCVRKEADHAVQMRLLERTCVEKAKKKAPAQYRLPPKKEKIGIIGGGPEGMACAAVLAGKNYKVTVFEKEHAIGGQLAGLLPEEVYFADFERQIKKENCLIKTNCEIREASQLESFQFDYLYKAAGKKRKDAISAIAEGIRAARQIELFFKTGRIMRDSVSETSFFAPDPNRIMKQEPVSSENDVFTEEEAVREAKRCVRCRCDNCLRDCDLSAFYQKWPSEMKEETVTTVMPSQSMIHKVYAQLIHSCTQCGKLEKSCPAGIQLGEMFLEARKSMHRQKKTPPAYHGFWIADMQHADSGTCSMCRNAPGTQHSRYVFFPGCNLGADDPEYVLRLYGWLVEQLGEVGILLRCCGIHGEWAGDEALSEDSISEIRKGWQALGKPQFLTACPACQKYLNRVLPEVQAVSVYEMMSMHGKWPVCDAKKPVEVYTIFDPCTAGANGALKRAVRESLEQAKISINELPEEAQGGCCGFGGDIGEANPEFADYLAKKRVSQMGERCVTYCVNCRDIFTEAGKKTFHILDLLFGIHPQGRKGTDYTERRKNRELVKKRLLEQYWKEAQEEAGEKAMKVICSEDVRLKMKKLRLYEEQIREVIEKSKERKRRIYDRDTDEYIGYSMLDYITCWVRYREQNQCVYITNVYTHRMNIKLEEVWNGRKMEPDL